MIEIEEIKRLIKERNETASLLLVKECSTKNKKVKKEVSFTTLLDKCSTKEEIELLMKERGLL